MLNIADRYRNQGDTRVDNKYNGDQLIDVITLVLWIIIYMNIDNSYSMKAINVNKEKDNNSNSNDDDDNKLNDEVSNMSINSNSYSNRHCLCCLKAVEGSMRCSKCRTALYCNRDCQLKHWPVHKNSCQDSNADDSDEKLYMKAENNNQQG